MPIVTFDALPSDARVWVFAADRVLGASELNVLASEMDAFLAQWNAHGHALRCARDERGAQFLAVGVDQSTAGASGCSIDGLFRTFKRLEPELGVRLFPGARVFWRDVAGTVRSGTRAEFAAAASSGDVTSETHVFDTSVTTAAAWRDTFEPRARDSWHGALLPASR